MTPSITRRVAASAALAAALLAAGPLGARWPALADSPAGTITTYAGGGADDHGPAVGAAVSPNAIAVGPAGELYIADRARVRMVRNGIITTVAGTGDPGHSGDGGSATQAQITDATGITVDRSGNLYISDSGSGNDGTVRRIDTRGVITTIASTLQSPAGLAVDGAGNVYVAEKGLNRVIEVPAGGGSPTSVAGNGASTAVGWSYGRYPVDGIPAVAATLTAPSGVALDAAGNLYIADTGDDRVREVDHASGMISTVLPIPGRGSVMGRPEPGPLSTVYTPADASVVSQPQDVAVDRNGILYVVDSGNARVLAVRGGAVITALDGGPGAQGIALTSAGSFNTLYVATLEGVYQYQSAGTTYRGSGILVAGSPDGYRGGDGLPAIDVDLVPSAVAFDPARHAVLIVDGARIRYVTAAGDIETLAGTGVSPGGSASGADVVPGDPARSNVEGLPARALNLMPVSVAVGRTGEIYFGDANLGQVLRFGADGIVHVVAGGAALGRSAAPGGTPSGDGGPAITANLGGSPTGLTISPAGDVYIAAAGRIRVVDGRGRITTYVGGDPAPTCNPANAYSVVPPPPDGNGPAAQACLTNPAGLAFDKAGSLCIADRGANRIRRVDDSGTITTVAGSGVRGFAGDGQAATDAALNGPASLAFDTEGDMFIADTGNQLVREVNTSGTISTVAGSITAHLLTTAGDQLGLGATTADYYARYSRGDGGPATSAYLVTPSGVAFDARGNLYIADGGDGRVRRMAADAAAKHTHSPSATASGSTSEACAATPDEAIENQFILSPHSSVHRSVHASIGR